MTSQRRLGALARSFETSQSRLDIQTLFKTIFKQMESALVCSAPLQGTSPSNLDDGHVESPQQQQQQQLPDKGSAAGSSSSSGGGGGGGGKHRKRKVRFADGVTLEDGDSRERLMVLARHLSQKHYFSLDSAEASEGAAADAECSSSGRILRSRSCKVSKD